MQERKCFGYRGFRHIIRNYRLKKQMKVVIQLPSNIFEVLSSRVIQRGEGSGNKIVKDRKTILREEREKKKVIEVKRNKEE